MPSPRYVAKYGAIRFLSCPGRAAIVSKFRAVSGTACKMPSPTPPKSAKVELRACEEIDDLILRSRAQHGVSNDGRWHDLACDHPSRRAHRNRLLPMSTL